MGGLLPLLVAELLRSRTPRWPPAKGLPMCIERLVQQTNKRRTSPSRNPKTKPELPQDTYRAFSLG